jgi:acetolactate synthase-1/2/3 large subunit
VKLAEAYGWKGIRIEARTNSTTRSGDDRDARPGDLRLPASTKKENCFPMIPSGAAHNEMILGITIVTSGTAAGDRPDPGAARPHGAGAQGQST